MLLNKYDLAKKIKNYNLVEDEGIIASLKDDISNNKTTVSEAYYAINEGIITLNNDRINEFGDFVRYLNGNNEKDLWINFYDISAKNGSILGHVYCAKFYINAFNHGVVCVKKALWHANIAIKLSPNKDEHKNTLAEVFFANKNIKESANAIIEYFIYTVALENKETDNNKKSRLKNELIYASEIVKKIVFEVANIMIIYRTVDCHSYWAKIMNIFLEFEEIILANKNGKSIINYAKFIIDKYHEKLGTPIQERPFYGQIINPDYLLTCETACSYKNLIINDFDKAFEGKPAAEKNKYIIESGESLENNGMLLDNLDKFWKKEADWFSSCDEVKINEEYKKSTEQLDSIMLAKKTEIESIKETKDVKIEGNHIQKAGIDSGLLQPNPSKAKESLSLKHKKLLPEYRKTYRRHAAERHFFDPKRSKKKESLKKLTADIVEQRFNYANSTEIKPIPLKEKSARLFITAERVFQETVICLFGLPEKNNQPMSCIPIANRKPWEKKNDHSGEILRGETTYGPIEKYTVGKTKIQSEHRTDPKPQRLGDSFLPKHGTYDKYIYHFLNKLAQEDAEKEKKLASYLLRYAKAHEGISLAELQELYPDGAEKDVKHFNRICFLIMEKEQGQWHCATAEAFQLGMSVSQARCLILLEAGYLRLKDAFKNNVLFGVYSQTGIVTKPENVAASCDYIDSFYMAYLQSKRAEDYLPFFRNNIKIKDKLTLVLTRKQAHEDLKYVYGGNSDTDGEGYDSDLSLS